MKSIQQSVQEMDRIFVQTKKAALQLTLLPLRHKKNWYVLVGDVSPNFLNVWHVVLQNQNIILKIVKLITFNMCDGFK